jgi:O-antigen/teichoic acid export membrane protein
VLATALYPTLATMYQKGRTIFSRAASRATELTVAIILPGVVGLLLLGNELLALIFDSTDFDESVPVLRLLALGALCAAIASILGRVLIAADRESTTLRIAVINTSVQIIAGVALTMAFGVLGAAVAALVVALVNVIQHVVPTKRIAPSLSITSTLWAPLVAAGAMAIAVLGFGGAPVMFRVVVGAVVYVIALGATWLVAAGGRSGLRARWALGS